MYTKIAAPLSSMFSLRPHKIVNFPGCRAGGPAPKHDLNGAWVGPLKASHGECLP